MFVRSRLALRCTFSNATFARYVPFDDAREVVTRRGSELGFAYGHEQARRTVSLHGMEASIVTFLTPAPSPPMLVPDSTPIVDASHFEPKTVDVVYLPDVEILVSRGPDGFDDAEVARILQAVEAEPF